MTDFAPQLSQDERRRLRRESIDLARVLVETDTIEYGVIILANYRRAFGRNDDHHLKFGLGAMFLCDLLSKCCCHQARRVSYLLDEHLANFGSLEMQRLVREHELAMFRKFRDKQGIAKSLRILTTLNRQP